MKLEDLNLNMHFFDPNATLVHGAVSTAVVHRNCTTGWQSILGRFLACIARPYHTIPYPRHGHAACSHAAGNPKSSTHG